MKTISMKFKRQCACDVKGYFLEQILNISSLCRLLNLPRVRPESEYFTGDTSVDIHSPGPKIAKTSLYRARDVNLATGSSELSAEDIIDAGSAFQSLMVSGKKLYL